MLEDFKKKMTCQRKSLKNLDIVDTRVHIELISQMVGGVGLS